MHSQFLRAVIWPVFALATCAWAQQPDSCASMVKVKISGVEITRAHRLRREALNRISTAQVTARPLPAYCRVEGVINRRTGVAGEEFGINFALAMPENWNDDFLMQGGGGANGIVMRRWA